MHITFSSNCCRKAEINEYFDNILIQFSVLTKNEAKKLKNIQQNNYLLVPNNTQLLLGSQIWHTDLAYYNMPWIKKKSIQKIFWSKHFFGPKKIFGSKKYLVPKKFWSQKNLVPKKSWLEKECWSKKNLSLKQNFAQKKMFVPNKLKSQKKF